MSLLGKQQGIFSIHESDKYVGSFISRNDVKQILQVSNEDLHEVPFKTINDGLYIDEKTLRKYWEKDKIPNAVPHKKGRGTISLDEYILISIIRDTYPEAKAVSQYKWGRKNIDIYVELNSTKKFFIEFHGPGHFTKLSIHRDPEDPFIRKRQIEDAFGIPCFIWPYWILRSANNLKLLIGEATSVESIGRGALWSTSVFFGQFFWDNSASIIEELTKPFNAASHGYGYFYEKWDEEKGPIKAAHPIINKILEEKESVKILIPKGCPQEDIYKWLPQCLQAKILSIK